ncbi:MAG: hypothetical protein J7L61_01330 [Thermoplasmata archaeon]|nr:hypothetical protein [Thermoplasmata archaeon]
MGTASLLISETVSGAGVGVWNSPPTFASITVKEDDRISLYLNVSDYNGWEDIFRVTVDIYNPDGDLVESVIYQQYPSNVSSVRIDEFTEARGEFLIPPDEDNFYAGSHVRRFSGEGWFIDNTTQEIVFIFKPFAGTRMRVVAEDSKGEMGVHQGPFSSKYIATPLVEGAAVPLSISLIVSAVGATLVTVDRYHNNKLAMRLMRMRGGGG